MRGKRRGQESRNLLPQISDREKAYWSKWGFNVFNTSFFCGFECILHLFLEVCTRKKRRLVSSVPLCSGRYGVRSRYRVDLSSALDVQWRGEGLIYIRLFHVNTSTYAQLKGLQGLGEASSGRTAGGRSLALVSGMMSLLRLHTYIYYIYIYPYFVYNLEAPACLCKRHVLVRGTHVRELCHKPVSFDRQARE